MLAIRFPISLVFAAVLSVGCTSTCQKSRDEMNPDDVVKAYLDLVFNMEELAQRDDLLELTAGSLKAAIAGASNETITEAYIEHRYALTRFSLIERRDRTPRETEVTYEIVYREKVDGVKDFEGASEVTTENTVAVIRENRRWYIREVLGNRTTIDFPIGSAITISKP